MRGIQQFVVGVVIGLGLSLLGGPGCADANTCLRHSDCPAHYGCDRGRCRLLSDQASDAGDAGADAQSQSADAG